MLTVANLTIIGKMASRSCYLENGGFSKWCLKLVWVWPFLSNPGCFGVACYLRNAVHCQCMPHSDGYNYILNQWCGCKFKCLQILQDAATVMSKTFGFRGKDTFVFNWVLFWIRGVVETHFQPNMRRNVYSAYENVCTLTLSGLHLLQQCTALIPRFITNSFTWGSVFQGHEDPHLLPE